MKKYFTLLLFTLLFFSSEIYSQWIRQYIDENVNLYDVRFINKHTGWICGGNLIYKTTNSGITWKRQSNPSQTGNLFQIHPINDNVVFACGQCTILKTINGGENWEAIRVGNPPCGNILPVLYGLWFKDENSGWFCGNVQTLRTTNGGTSLIDSMRIELYATDIHFKDDTAGVIIGEGRTYRTTNSGMNWNIVPLPFTISVPDCWRASFIGNTGWTVSNGNVIFKTSTFGLRWDSITYANVGSTLYPIEFVNLNTGYAGGDPASIFKTTDGGFIWTNQQIPQTTPSGYLSIFALNDSIIWAVGGYGKIIYTENGGLVKIINSNNTSQNTDSLYQNYPNPFNPATLIKFNLKEQSKITIKVYDVIGRVISCLINEFKTSGSYEIEFESQNLPCGVYIYTMELNNKLIESRKMVILK